ncbi:hypothetical protein [Comamonas sp. 4034]|uniref:hypothetical protein n=1 Tax=Comamonas sp. 4034 TaxID=3156455 RepID=UPI003D1C661E
MSEELPPHARPLSELLLAAGLVLQDCGGGGSISPAPTPPTAEQLKAICLSLAGQVIEGVTITKTTRHEQLVYTAASGATTRRKPVCRYPSILGTTAQAM